MANKPQPGSVAVKRATTGRLYFTDQLTPGIYDAGEIDLGNVVKWKRKNKTETVEHMKSEGGIRIVDDERVHTLAFGYVFTLDEFGPTALELIQKTNADTTVTQAGVAAGTSVTINNVVQGRTYSIGKLNVTLESVKIGAVTKNGYTFNAATGRITITEGGDIPDLSAIIITYGASAADFSRRTSATNARRVGKFTFVEQDQESDTPRAVHTWVGSMWVDADGEFQVPEYGTFELNVTCQTPPVVDERKN